MNPPDVVKRTKTLRFLEVLALIQANDRITSMHKQIQEEFKTVVRGKLKLSEEDERKMRANTLQATAENIALMEKHFDANPKYLEAGIGNIFLPSTKKELKW